MMWIPDVWIAPTGRKASMSHSAFLLSSTASSYFILIACSWAAEDALAAKETSWKPKGQRWCGCLKICVFNNVDEPPLWFKLHFSFSKSKIQMCDQDSCTPWQLDMPRHLFPLPARYRPLTRWGTLKNTKLTSCIIARMDLLQLSEV